MREGMKRQELIEQLAAIEHERWGHWMGYLTLQCEMSPDGTMTIPASLVERWRQQTETPYVALREREQQSDREWAQKLLPVFDAYTGQVSPQEEVFLGPFRCTQGSDGTWSADHLLYASAQGATMREAMQDLIDAHPELKTAFSLWSHRHVDQFLKYFGPRTDEEGFTLFAAIIGEVVGE